MAIVWFKIIIFFSDMQVLQKSSQVLHNSPHGPENHYGFKLLSGTLKLAGRLPWTYLQASQGVGLYLSDWRQPDGPCKSSLGSVSLRFVPGFPLLSLTQFHFFRSFTFTRSGVLSYYKAGTEDMGWTLTTLKSSTSVSLPRSSTVSILSH